MDELTEREHELTRKLSHDEFEARGQARSRYHARLAKQGRPRPTNEQFDEGFEAARSLGEWTAIRTADDLPKVGCNIWLQNANGEIFTDAFAPSFPGNTLKYYLEKVAWMLNPMPAPYQPQAKEAEQK